MIFQRLCVLSAVFLMVVGAQPAVAQLSTSTVTAFPINVGMSVSLTGQNSEIGQDIQQGVQTYFNKVNSSGGVAGHPLQLIVMDDGYEPQRAAQNVQQLINQYNVIAVLGNNGSESAAATIPVVQQAKVLLFGAFGGAGVLHKKPPDRYVINFRTSYVEEMNSIISGLIAAGIRPEEFAFFTQDDAFGDNVYNAAAAALKAAGYAMPESLPMGRYSRNTANVQDALTHIINASIKPPKVIILGGTLAPNARFIQLASKEFPDTYFVSVAGFVKAEDLAPENEGKVLVSQVVPYFPSGDLPAMKEYLQDLKQYGHSAVPGAISFQAYLTAKIFVVGLQMAVANNQLTREGIIDAFESMRDVDIGIGVLINYDKTDHEALDVATWPSVFQHGEFVPLQWSQWAP